MENKRLREIAAAMTASTAVPTTLNWTDFIKTRMQTPQASGCTALPYSGGFSSVAKRLLAEEGAFAMWSTGLPASLMREALAVGTRWGAYPLLRDCLAIAAGHGPSNKLIAGAVLGGISGLLASPCDLVRIRLQVEAGVVGADGILATGLHAGQRLVYRHSFHGFGSIVSNQGFTGLFRGSAINVLRSVCTTVGSVPVYDITKTAAKEHLGVADGPSLHFGAGFVTGIVGTTLTAPADVLRTRIMAHAESPGILGAAGGVVRDHGPLGFFRGWLPAYMRMGPLFFCMPALVEQSRKRLFGLDYMS